MTSYTSCLRPLPAPARHACVRVCIYLCIYACICLSFYVCIYVFFYLSIYTYYIDRYTYGDKKDLVTTQVRASFTLFELFFSQVSHQGGRKARLDAELNSRLHFKRKRGESERWRRRSAGCEHVQALGGEKRAKMLGKSDRERKLYDTSTTALAGKTESKAQKPFQGDLKRQVEVFKGLSENTRFQGI